MTESKNWDWMVEKDYKDNHFYYTDEKFLRYFGKDKNENESKKTELLAEKLKECTEKIHSAGLITNTGSSETRLCLQLGYTENYGYYALEDNDRGHYSVPYGLPSENLDTAVIMIIRHIIWSYSLEFERINHRKLEKDFNSRFNKYNVLACQGCLYWAEYCLSVWKVLYDNSIPKEVIAYYEAYMNDVSIVKYITPYMWKYNAEDGRFVLIKEESIMTKLEEARKLRMLAKEFYWENEKLKEQILDVIIEVLNHNTEIGEFNPIKIVFQVRTLENDDDILVGWYTIQYHTYKNENKVVNFEKSLPNNLDWYARVIHAYLSEQEELEVTELCQSEEEDCTSFTVNFK